MRCCWSSALSKDQVKEEVQYRLIVDNPQDVLVTVLGRNVVDGQTCLSWMAQSGPNGDHHTHDPLPERQPRSTTTSTTLSKAYFKIFTAPCRWVLPSPLGSIQPRPGLTISPSSFLNIHYTFSTRIHCTTELAVRFEVHETE